MPEKKDIITSVLDFFQKISSEKEVTIKFQKKDGTIRIMKCTLDFEKIPNNKKPKNISMSKILSQIQKNHLVHVFDLEKQSWRSVPFNRVEWMETSDKIFNVSPTKL